MAIAAARALMLVGVPRIHAFQRDCAGRLGAAAVALACLGLVLMASARLAVDLDLLPGWPTMGAAITVVLLGVLRLGAGIIHAGVLPRGGWAADPGHPGVLRGQLRGPQRLTWLFLLFGVAWVWLGAALWIGATGGPRAVREGPASRSQAPV